MKRTSYTVAVISLLAVIILLLFDIKDPYEPDLLLPILNNIFLGVLPVCMASISFVVYTRTNLLNLFLFGCGMLVFGLGSTVAGWVRGLPDGANMTVTIHNTSALIASVLHLAGTFKREQRGQHHKKTHVIIILSSVCGIFAVLALLLLLTNFHLLPPFYIQETPSILRQIVLGTSILLFFASSIFMISYHRRQRNDYYFWYSATLMLISIGLFAVSVQQSVGSPIGWIGRFDQYLGGISSFIAVYTLIKATKLKTLQLQNFVKDFFSDAEYSYKELVESSNDAIVTIDGESRICLANTAALNLFELHETEAMGSPFFEFIHQEEDRKLLQSDMETFIRTKKSNLSRKIIDVEAISRGGRVFPISMTVSTRQLQHDFACTYIVRDISMWKQAEKQRIEMTGELRQQLEFERMVKTLAQGFINTPIETIDQNINHTLKIIGEYCAADRITIYLYNWEEETIQLHYEWVKEKKYCIDERYKVIPFTQMSPRIFEKHKSGKYDTASVDNNDSTNQYFMTDINKTGALVTTSIPLTVDDKVLGTCILSKMGDKQEWDELILSSIIIFCEMLANVLQRINYEKALIQSNERNKLLLDATNDAFLMLDKAGDILNINMSFAKRYGRTPQEMIGTNWMEYMPEEKYGSLYKQRMRHFINVFKTGEPEIFEDSRDGMTFYNRFYPVFINGAIISVALFSTDITDRIKAIDEARTAAEYQARLKVQTEFFTNLSHEFKTPLSIILVQLELMKLYRSDEEKMDRYLQAATQNAYRITRLVRNLIDITKLDEGYLPAELRLMDIVPILRNITESVNDFALMKSIDLKFKTRLLGYYMAVDKDKIERIMLNLLSNAVKHTEKGGTITVTVKGKENSIIIIVSDTGEGIPKEKQGVIFERFAHADTSLTRRNEGSGLGLYLTKSLVELLKGEIRAESVPGKGSTFIVELPMQEIEDSQSKTIQIEGYDFQKRVEMEFSDIYFHAADNPDLKRNIKEQDDKEKNS